MSIVVILKPREDEPGAFEGGCKGNSGERLRYTPCAGRLVRYRLITAPDNPAVGCDRSPARLRPLSGRPVHHSAASLSLGRRFSPSAPPVFLLFCRQCR